MGGGVGQRLFILRGPGGGGGKYFKGIKIASSKKIKTSTIWRN